MPRSAEDNAELRERSREALLDAALSLFAEKGFDRASMRELAQRAGVSKGLAYHYFPSKDALLDALLARRRARVARLLRELPEALSPAEQVGWLVDAVLRDAVAHAGVHRLHLAVFATSRGRAAPRGDRDGVGRALIDLLRRAGSEEPETDAHLLKVTLAGLVQEIVLAPEPRDVVAVRDRLLRALGLPTPPP